jgi:hypothetical protein
MTISIERFSEDHIPAVREFNKRIEAVAGSYRFPESPIPQWLPRRDPIPLYQEFFVALEGNMVRGAYVMKPQAFSFDGKVTMIANFELPISEGIVDRRYAHVGLLILKEALKRQPLLFALGGGSYNEPITQMLKAANWSMVSCPFYFKVNHPFRFLREIVFLRRKRSRRIILDALAFSGLGWTAIKSLQSLKGLTQGAAADLTSEEVESFFSWADEIWKRAKDDYAMIAVRDAAILNTLYPSMSKRFRRIKVLRCGEVIGWAVLLNTKMDDHKQFGGMRVGSVVDCLAVEGEEYQVVAMATRYLERLGIDIIVTNQQHRSWCKAFSGNGYLVGPSNYIFAVSPQLAEKLTPFEVGSSKVHLTRGDGDGPINL